MRENLRLNGLNNVTVAQMAAGNSFGWARFSDFASDDLNKIISDGSGIIVPLVKLEYFLTREKIKLIKIDVEGYEKYVLEGIGSVLKNTEFIYFECYDRHFKETGTSFAQIYNLLISEDFTIAELHGNELNIVQRDYTCPTCRNLIAFRNAADIRNRLSSLK